MQTRGPLFVSLLMLVTPAIVAGLDHVERRVIAVPDVAAALAQDARREGPVPHRVAVPVAEALSPDTAGSWEPVPGGDFWRLRVASPGASFLSFKFSELRLRDGAELRFVSFDRDFEAGPYGERHARSTRRFGSPMVPGAEALVELWVPDGAEPPVVSLESVSHGFRPPIGEAAPAGGQFSCQVDINCPEGQPFQVVKRAMAEGYDGSFVCSGQLVNNVRQDQRYFYLTAAHCNWWQDPNGMEWYWNYENSGCGNNDAPFTFSSGSTSLFHDEVADVNLLELDGTDLEGMFNVYFVGWDLTPLPATTSSMISFPDDKPKQIVIDDDPSIDCDVGSCPGGWGDDWWRITDWEVGVDEGGSSGGGLLDENLRLRGVLTGGVGTDCNDFEWDEFAKIHPQWSELAPFLDPDDTGATSVPGLDPNAPAPPPPPVADGDDGDPLRARLLPDGLIQVSFDAATCSAERAVVVWGTVGDWGGYQGDSGADCSLGDGGFGTFDLPAGAALWFNLLWVDGDDNAGRPGSGSAGPRPWSAAGLCQVVADDTRDAVCD